ncbi:MAG: TIGR03668 family PPOX class F420-dependent oxidoreductase [Candidatus Binatia bacterium]
MPLTAAQKKFLDRHRIGHLATADCRGRPHVVPICYACDGSCLYSVLDAKPKRVPAAKLKRLRNIQDNPRVAVVIDEYDEDWTRLAYTLVHGTATVLSGGEKHARALRLLRDRYPQYRAMPLEGCPVIRITIERAVSWNALDREWRQR